MTWERWYTFEKGILLDGPYTSGPHASREDAMAAREKFVEKQRTEWELDCPGKGDYWANIVRETVGVFRVTEDV